VEKIRTFRAPFYYDKSLRVQKKCTNKSPLDFFEKTVKKGACCRAIFIRKAENKRQKMFFAKAG